MNIIITGGTGIIGLSLIEELLARCNNILVLASPGSPRNRFLAKMASPYLQWQECGLADYDSFTTDALFDAMVHMAWTGGLDRWNIDLNLFSARQCAAAARLAARLGCHTFIGTGSQAECGPQITPLSGTTLCKPDTPFGAAKNLARDLARIEVRRKPSMRFIWARILSVYGPRDRESAMITCTIRKLLRREVPEFSSGEQVWDFLYAEDSATALAQMLERGCDDQIYVLGSGRPRLLRDYLDALVRPVGINLEECLYKVEIGQHTPRHLTADIDLLTKDLGWKPLVDFDIGVARTIEYCRANPE